jgi:hypothetical protein
MVGIVNGLYTTGKLAVGKGVLPSDYTSTNDVIFDVKASGNASMFRIFQNGSQPYVDIDTYLHMSGESVRGLDTSIITGMNEGLYGDYAAPVSYIINKFEGGDSNGSFNDLTIGGNTILGDGIGSDTLDVNADANFDGGVVVNTTTQSTAPENGALIIKGGVGIAKRLNVGESVTIHGNLTVLGNYSVSDVETSTYQDPLIILGNGTTGDTNDLGFLAKYDGPLNDQRYAGLYRDADEATQSFILGFDIAHDPNTDNIVISNVELADLRVGGMYVNDTLNVDGDVDADVSTFDVLATSSASDAISLHATLGSIVLDVDDTTAKLAFISGGNQSNAIDINSAGGIDIDAIGKFDVNALDIELDSSGLVIIDAVTTIDVQSGGAMTLDAAGSSAIGIGTDANTGTINVGTSATTRSINVGNDVSTIVDVNALNIQLDSGGPVEINATTTLNMQSGGQMRIDADGASVLNIATDGAGTGNVNIATNAAARSIIIGNDASTIVDVNALDIQLDSGGPIVANAVGLIDVQSGGAMTLDAAGSSAIGIGTDADTGTINIGTSATARTINIGNDASTLAHLHALDIHIDSGGPIEINATSTLDMQSGGDMTIDADGASTLNIGVDAAATGDINIGTNEQARDISIGNAVTNSLTLAAVSLNIVSSGPMELNATGSLEIQATGEVSIDADGSSVLNLGTDGAGSGTINIGTNDKARSIAMGNDASTIIDLNALDIQIDSGGPLEINATTTLFMQAGGEVRLDADGVSTLNIATDGAGSGDVNIATNDAARSIAIGHDSSNILDLNALDIQVDSGGPIEINATTTLQMQSGGNMTIDADDASTLDIATGTAGTGNVNLATGGTGRTLTIGNAETSLMDVTAKILTYTTSNNTTWTTTVDDPADLQISFTGSNTGPGDINFLVNVGGDVRMQAGVNDETVINDAGTLTHFRVEGTGAGSSNLIYAKADGADTSLGNVTYNGCVGIGKIPSGFRLDVEGSGQFSGYVTCPSDQRLKINVEPIPNPLEKIALVSGVTYNWDIENFPERNFTNDVQVGFIAQEMEKVLPQAVLIAEDGFRSLAYDRVTALLWEAVKAQQVQIKALQEQMANH